MRRLPTLVAATLVPIALLLSGCSGGSSETANSGQANESSVSNPDDAKAEVFSNVTLTPGEEGKPPTVSIDGTLDAPPETTGLLRQGDGAQIEPGQKVNLRSVGIRLDTGEQMSENFSRPTGVVNSIDDSLKSQNPDVYNLFTSAKVGAYIGIVVDLSSLASAAPNSSEPPPSRGLIVGYIESVVDTPDRLSDAEVSELDSQGKLPGVTFNDQGVPSVSIPSGQEPPNGLVAKVLKAGDGAVLQESSQIVADYAGWRWDDGQEFDSSYSRGDSATFSLSGVIEGWTKGLSGQKVGSQVLLVIPGSMAYGDDASGGRPAGTLVFVVEIRALA